MKSKFNIGKIITSSLLCFSFGTIATSLSVASIDNFTSKTGKGGLETSKQPVFNSESSDYMAVADDSNEDYGDPDFLPEIEILEDDLVFQDSDDESFNSVRELFYTYSIIPDGEDELYFESDFASSMIDTRTFDLDQNDKDEEGPAEIPAKVASEIVYLDDDLGNEDLANEVKETIAEVKEETKEASKVIEETAAEVAVVDNSQPNTIAEEIDLGAPLEIIGEGDSIAKVIEEEIPGFPVKTDSSEEFYSEIKRADDTVRVPDAPEVTYTLYRVKQGDNLSKIAKSYGLREDTIYSVNNITDVKSLKTNSYLKIPSNDGLIYTIKSKGQTAESVAKKYKVDAQKCALVNNKRSISDEFALNSKIFVPEAKMDPTSKLKIEGKLWLNPLKQKYRITSPFGWRVSPFNASKRSYHTGIDLAIASGTPIYAARNGKVVAATYTNVYGNYVKIQHDDGYYTLYGHMTRSVVTSGQDVTTDTIIGYVGSTGQSTGPHLHFTLFKGSTTINPYNVLQF